MASATARIDALLSGLTEKYSHGEAPGYDPDVAVAVQVIQNLCERDFRISDKIEAMLQSGELTASNAL